MKSKKLIKMFSLYMASLPIDTQYVTDEDQMSSIFGDDEFSIQRKTKKIFLKGVGEVYCPSIKINQPNPDWIAIYEDKEGWVSILGMGNPYQNIDNLLPTKNGAILAVPRSLSKKLKGESYVSQKERRF